MTRADGYRVRLATDDDRGGAVLDGARSVMLDTFYGELGTGYVPRWHRDVVDLEGAYLDTPRQHLVVALDPDGEVVGTTAVRNQGPNHPPHAPWLVERYSGPSVAQIFRVYVRAAHRRRGLARELVAAAVDAVAADGGYDTIYLHSNVTVPGAEAFWRSLAREVHDGRPDGTSVIHFEIDVPVLTGSASAPGSPAARG